MKKNLFLKAVAALTMIALAVAITVTPGTALAAMTGVTISAAPGQSYDINVGGTVTLTANLVGVPDGVPEYLWSANSGVNISFDDATLASPTVTGLKPGTSTVVSVQVTDPTTPGVHYSASVTIKIGTMTISNTTLALNGGATQPLSVGNISSGSSTVWSSNKDTTVASVDASTGLVTAIGAGTAVITVVNTPTSGEAQTKTCTVTVSPLITITPATQNITTANTSGSVKITVEYGGELITSASTVAWANSNTTAGALTSSPSALTPNGSALECIAVFQSNATGVNATTNITGTISGTGNYKVPKTAVINVRTQRYITVEGDATLNKTDRYGDYTLTLHEANGDVVDNDTSTAHWSWSSSYLSVSNAALNADRAKMTDGVARIQLYARYNTTSSGTRVYAWIDDASGSRVYSTVVISGLSSLPQTGQDMTLIYALGGSAILLFVAAGVWYGIRKKQTAV